jgi:hypothetical protein
VTEVTVGLTPFPPKHGVNPKFVHLVNQNHEIVSEHLTQDFVPHRRISAAPQTIAKFALRWVCP